VQLDKPTPLPGDATTWAHIRKGAGLSAVQLAAAIGVSVPTLYAWENGSHSPTGLNREAYAKALRELQHLAEADV
jgi:DNA-binding transcriptional regulator YiaG